MKDLFSPNPVNGKDSVRLEWTQITQSCGSSVIKAKPTVFLMTRSEQARLTRAKVKIQKEQGNRGARSDTIKLSDGGVDVPHI